MNLTSLSLLCFISLHTAIGTIVRLRVYKHFPDTTTFFDVSAVVDIKRVPATIAVTKNAVNQHGRAIDFKGFIALLKEVSTLRPISVPVDSYIIFRIVIEYEEICVTDIGNIVYGKEVVTIFWNASAKFMANEDPTINYLMDIGDGGPVVGVYATKSETSNGPNVVQITERQARKFGSTIGEIKNRLEETTEMYIGGPYFQIVDHKLLRWTALTDLSVGTEGLNLTLAGNYAVRQKYWIKRVGSYDTLYTGTLVQPNNGSIEFRIAHNGEPNMVVQTILKAGRYEAIKEDNRHKVNLAYESGLCISVSEEKSFLKHAIAIPDMKIFDVANVTVVGGNIVISFAWHENIDGRSYVHAIKLNLDGQPTFLIASICFEQDRRSGIAVIHGSIECTENRKEYLQKVRKSLAKQAKDGIFTIDASAPLFFPMEVDSQGKNINTPLQLKIESYGFLGDYSFQIGFVE